MIEEDKKLIQDVIDRLLYNVDFKDKLIELINNNPINREINYKKTEFKFHGRS